MKAASFEYHDPASLAEAVALLATHPDARPLAGGQSLVPMLNMRYVIADHLVDLNRIAELDFIRQDGETLAIGAMTRQRALMDSDLVRATYPIIPEALACVGHFQTRNRGTIGGSLCHLDPAAELPTLLLALDAVLIAANEAGRREIAISDWAFGYMTPALEPGELLTEVRIPLWPERHGYAFLEFARRHGDFAIVGVAALVVVEGNVIRRAAIALGGTDARPLRLVAAEEALVGQTPGALAFAAAAEIARDIDAISDAYVTSSYRQRLAGVLVERALARACERTGGWK